MQHLPVISKKINSLPDDFFFLQGNCEIAELLIRSAEKLDIRLDQYVNREGKFSSISFITISIIQVVQQLYLHLSTDI